MRILSWWTGMKSVCFPTCDETWASDLPHVIYGIVEVEPGCSLTILPATQVHVHDGGGLLVYQSTLNISAGQLGQEVVFPR